MKVRKNTLLAGEKKTCFIRIKSDFFATLRSASQMQNLLVKKVTLFILIKQSMYLSTSLLDKSIYFCSRMRNCVHTK
jgi:hypothetical protein